jgi:hypothetical protein
VAAPATPSPPAATESAQPPAAGIATRIVDERRKAQARDTEPEQVTPADVQPSTADDRPPSTAPQAAAATQKKKPARAKPQPPERGRQRDAPSSQPAGSGWKITPDQGRKLD